MKYIEFKEKVVKHLSNYKVNELGCVKNGLYQNSEYPHILPSGLRNLNFLLGVTPPMNINYHMYSHHLNSSQIMGINFFEPLMKSEILLEVLREALDIDISTEATILESTFEYSNKDLKDGTHFNFYLKLSTGENIYFEIKYTEEGFGKISKSKEKNKFPNKYEAKFEDVYKKQLSQSKYLKELAFDKDRFYKDYQINRNISYIKGEKDHVVFLFPFENESLLAEVENLSSLPQVHVTDWKSLELVALKKSENTPEYRILEEFLKKYYI